ncbi:MAG TPA: RluA family pseudouridine synthase [Polyangiaceae bacterium]|nr:RluA family pseudouridine synthase [Polyangiaceae bacterium]
MARFVVDVAHSGERVDKLLASLLPDVSRATVQRWIDEGRVRVDGRPCRGRDKPKPGAVLEWEPGEPPLSSVEPDASVAVVVVHEDEHLIVIDKPPGLVVHPARGHVRGTLVSGLLARGGFESLSREPGAHFRPGIVHRIDKDTSGLLVVAKDDKTREGLKAQFSARSVRREYRAITLGVPRSARIATQYGRHPKSRLRFSSKVSGGKPAATTIAVLERLAGDKAAWVSCKLETGRTHQIRVHLAEQANCPVFADALYQGVPKGGPLLPIAQRLGRQALHAHTLGFIHPITEQTLDFTSPIPTDIADALMALRALTS